MHDPRVMRRMQLPSCVQNWSVLLFLSRTVLAFGQASLNRRSMGYFSCKPPDSTFAAVAARALRRQARATAYAPEEGAEVAGRCHCLLIRLRDFCSGGSTENVMNAVHPSRRALASSSR